MYGPNDNYKAGIDSLQVVLTCDTNHSYRTRCLPGFMTKRYLNKHVLDGLHQTFEANPFRNNEIYQGHCVFSLEPYRECDPMRELEMLFQWKSVDGAFSYLDGIATQALGEYLYLKDKKLVRRLDTSRIDFEAQQELTNMLERTFDTTLKVILPQQIKKATHQILSNRKLH